MSCQVVFSPSILSNRGHEFEQLFDEVQTDCDVATNLETDMAL